jgi:adenosylmethionine---8-amino-7-oxononanoate aminotransferase
MIELHNLLSIIIYMSNFKELDLAHIWHPCMTIPSIKEYPPFVVNSAQGVYLYTDRGQIIDGIASWWCKSLGHRHPKVVAAIKTQLDKFEQVMMTNSTSELMLDFAQTLAKVTGKDKVLFASDGSSAVEIALKLALHAAQMRAEPWRQKFIALENGYHGETFATMAVSDLGRFKDPYKNINLECNFLRGLPYVSGKHDPLWQDCAAYWPNIEKQLVKYAKDSCALILEPIVQGSCGMRIYSADFLRRLANFARDNGIYLIADEIMTGCMRTGTWLALEHAGISADMICLSKGLSSGSLALSTVSVDDNIYKLFEHEQENAFLHSHTFGGNPLSLAAGLATLQTLAQENFLTQVSYLETKMAALFADCAHDSGKITNIRSIGAIIAGDLIDIDVKSFASIALNLGALLRPIGNTLYWLPPFIINDDVLEKLANITLQALQTCSV